MSSSVTFLMRKSWNHFVNLKGFQSFQGKPGRDNVKHWQRPTPEPHGRMPRSRLNVCSSTNMKPPWQLRYRAMTSSLMILCGITWIDFQKNHDQHYGTEFRYHKLWAQKCRWIHIHDFYISSTLPQAERAFLHVLT